MTLVWRTITFPQPIAVDDAGLYWGDVAGIWRCPKSSCSVGPTFVSGTPNGVFSLAIDDNNVYWTDSVSGVVLSAPKSGIDAGAKTLWQSSNLSANYVATDGQKVYFAVTDGLLHIVAVDAGPDAGQIAIGTADPNGAFGVAVQGGYVYWTVFNPGQGAVWGASTSSLSAAPIVVQQFDPRTVASDGTNLYWLVPAVNNNGQLLTCTIVGCTSPTALASHISLPREVIVDSNAVYWTDQANSSTPAGSVWKVAK
jgi:hypothetical protein